MQAPQAEKFSKSNSHVYKAYFDNVSIINRTLDETWLKEHRVTVLKPPCARRLEIRLQCLTNCGRTAYFTVSFGRFLVGIKVLNLEGRAYNNFRLVGGGGFGQIIATTLGGINLIAKRMVYNGDRETLNDIIQEYAFYKVCSLLGVGPQAALGNAFDLVCYDDCVEFLIEKCDPIKNLRFEESQQFENFARDIKQCVKTLHREGIMHVDIKPDNILYSPLQGRYVLTDFGISMYSNLQPGHRSLVSFRGSLNFVSPQMMKITTVRVGWVDLHYNDLHGLNATLEKVRIQCLGVKIQTPMLAPTSKIKSSYKNPPSKQSDSEQERTRTKQDKLKWVHTYTEERSEEAREDQEERKNEEARRKRRRQIDSECVTDNRRNSSISRRRIPSVYKQPTYLKKIPEQARTYVFNEKSFLSIYDCYNLLFKLFWRRGSDTQTQDKCWENLTVQGQRILISKVLLTGNTDHLDLVGLFDRMEKKIELEAHRGTKARGGRSARKNNLVLEEKLKKRSYGLFDSSKQLLSREALTFYRRCVTKARYKTLQQAWNKTKDSNQIAVLTSFNIQDGPESPSLRLESSTLDNLQKMFRFNARGLCQFLLEYPYFSWESRAELFGELSKLGKEAPSQAYQTQFIGLLNCVATKIEAEVAFGEFAIRCDMPFSLRMCLFVVMLERFRSGRLHRMVLEFCRDVRGSSLGRKVDTACLYYLQGVLETRTGCWQSCLGNLNQALELLQGVSPIEFSIETNVLTTFLGVSANLDMQDSYQQINRQLAWLATIHSAGKMLPSVNHHLQTAQARILLNNREFQACQEIINKKKIKNCHSNPLNFLRKVNNYYLLAYALLAQNKIQEALTIVSSALLLEDPKNFAMQRICTALLLLKVELLIRNNQLLQAFNTLVTVQVRQRETWDRQTIARQLYLQYILYDRYNSTIITGSICERILRLSSDPANPVERFKTALNYLQLAVSKYQRGLRDYALDSTLQAMECYLDTTYFSPHQLFNIMLASSLVLFRMGHYRQCIDIAKMLMTKESQLILYNRIYCSSLLAFSYYFLKDYKTARRYCTKVVDHWEEASADLRVSIHQCKFILRDVKGPKQGKVERIIFMIQDSENHLTLDELKQLRHFQSRIIEEKPKQNGCSLSLMDDVSDISSEWDGDISVCPTDWTFQKSNESKQTSANQITRVIHPKNMTHY